jgi:hypothetical protein
MLTLHFSSAVTFAALCVWLAVRFINRRERWAKWALVLAVGLPALYVGSFGPACWVSSHAEMGQTVVTSMYYPLGFLCVHDYRPFVGRRIPVASDALIWYSRVFAADDWGWTHTLELDRDGSIAADAQGDAIWRLEWGYAPPFPF